jgi:hypothetical protein
MSRILFIVKFREDSAGRCAYDGTPACYGGLYHSALFVVQMLRAAHVDAKLVQVCDNNDIDREVDRYKPDIVIIEGLWVIPEKFLILAQLHPRVRWVVRIHSEIPFLAYEGIAIQWVDGYVRQLQVYVAANSTYATRDLQVVVGSRYASKILCLPNFYPLLNQVAKRQNAFLDIGCFGALRPLKNQLLQGIAAIEFAEREKRSLRFHINERCEQMGDSVLKNLRALFDAPGRELVEHKWETREQFLETLSCTDIGMQVSFSETFDITAADTVSLGIPLVASSEIVWASPHAQASVTNVASIVQKLRDVTSSVFGWWIRKDSLKRLRTYCDHSRATWLHFAEQF